MRSSHRHARVEHERDADAKAASRRAFRITMIDPAMIRKPKMAKVVFEVQ
jgi:hypothetical protein